MKRAVFVFILSIAFSLSLTSCAGKKEILPTHDEVLTYPLPYDLTFLRTVEALESLPDWELSETEKEKGIIRVHNTNFSSFDDSDKRQATFIIQRVNRQETSIALAPYSQQVIGGDALFKRISQHISAEVESGSDKAAAQPAS